MNKILNILTVALFLITATFTFISCDKDDAPIKEAASIEIFSGNKQAAVVLETLTNPVVVLVKDEYGNPLAGKLVSFSVSEGSLSSETNKTDAYGKAKALWTLGGTIGTQTLEATVEGLMDTSVIFSVTGNQITVTDIDGYTYKAIVLGNQVWMAENLKTTHYANGIEINFIEDNTVWDNLENKEIAMSYYDNSQTNANTYGALYTWAAAMGGAESSSTKPSNVQGVCPDGWHLPSDAEWAELEMYLGMSKSEAYETGRRGTNQGSKLAGNEELWVDDILDSNAEFGSSGFMALPAGYRHSGGSFAGLNTFTTFWSSSRAEDDLRTYTHTLYHDDSSIMRNQGYNSNGSSVRCIRD